MANGPSYVDQRAQYAVEATSGVAQAPAHEFNRSKLTLSGGPETESLAASGSYYDTTSWRTKESSEATLSGVPDFNELEPMLDVSFGLPEVTTAEDGDVEVRTYVLKSERPTWTIVFGTIVAAIRAVFMYAKSFSLELGVNSGTASVEVGFAGGKLTHDGATSNSATGYPEAVVTGLNLAVYQASTFAGLATTTSADLVATLSANLKWEDLAKHDKYMDGTDSGVSALIATKVNATIDLMCPKGVASDEWLVRARSGETSYLRFLITGETIDGTTVERSLDIRTPVKTAGRSLEDEDGSYVSKPSLKMVKDVAGNVPTLILTKPAA